MCGVGGKWFSLVQPMLVLSLIQPKKYLQLYLHRGGDFNLQRNAFMFVVDCATAIPTEVRRPVFAIWTI